MNVINKRLFITVEHCCKVELAPLATLTLELEVVEPPDEGSEGEEAVDQDTVKK